MSQKGVKEGQGLEKKGGAHQRDRGWLRRERRRKKRKGIDRREAIHDHLLEGAKGEPRKERDLGRDAQWFVPFPVTSQSDWATWLREEREVSEKIAGRKPLRGGSQSG